MLIALITLATLTALAQGAIIHQLITHRNRYTHLAADIDHIKTSLDRIDATLIGIHQHLYGTTATPPNRTETAD